MKKCDVKCLTLETVGQHMVYWKMSWCVYNCVQNFRMVPLILCVITLLYRLFGILLNSSMFIPKLGGFNTLTTTAWFHTVFLNVINNQLISYC